MTDDIDCLGVSVAGNLQQEQDDRAARVKRFIAESDSNDIAALFAMIRDAVIEKEIDELFAISQFLRGTADMIADVERELCG